MSKKVYEIIWKYSNLRGQETILKVCEYLETSFPFLYRDQVVSANKEKLQKTLNYLNLIKYADEEFFIAEKKYGV